MTTQLEQAAKMALEALELEDMACRYEKEPTPEHIAKAITALRAALEQPAQDELDSLAKLGWQAIDCPICGGGARAFPKPAQDEPTTWVDAVMEQAQVFASAWSLVGGRFDDGSGMEVAEEAKAELRAMLTRHGIGEKK